MTTLDESLMTEYGLSMPQTIFSNIAVSKDS